MKRIITYTAVLILLFGCKKNVINFKGNDSLYESEETIRIKNVFNNRTIEVNVNFNNANIYPLLLGTVKNKNIEIFIEGHQYSLNQNESYNIELTEISKGFGKNVSIRTVFENVDIQDHNIYVPNEIIIGNDLSPFGKISKKNSKIYWNKDSNNLAGVIVGYTLYNNTFDKNPEVIETGMSIIEDDGELDLSKILSNRNAKSLDIFLQRGNAISHIYEDEKLAFYFITNDGFPFLEIVD